MDPRIKAAEVAGRAERAIDPVALAEYAEGKGTLGAALNLDGEEVKLIRGHGLAMLDAGHCADARAVFEALIAMGDEDPGVRFLVANACYALRDLEAAIVHFTDGLEELGNDGR